MSLTKADIIQTIADEKGWPKKEASKTVEILLEIIKQKLEAGEDVLISRFGKFCVREKGKRVGRNPATGEPLTLAPRKVVTFKSSGKLKALVNQNDHRSP